MFVKTKLNNVDKVIVLLAIAALIFSFTARFNFPYTRLFGSVWNLGHIAAFFIWTYLCLRFVEPVNRLNLLMQTLVLLSVSLLFGIFMEAAQFAIGRSAQIDDIISDLIGTSLAILFYSNKRSELTGKLRSLILFMLVCLIIFIHKNIILVPVNDYYTYKQFPVLINPSSPFEITKLDPKKIKSLSLENDGDKKYFKIVFSKAKYSTVMMGFFPLEWHGYNFLKINLVNPSQNELQIRCRIHDLPHIDNKYIYTDRFSKTYILEPGTNELVISLNEIVEAPKTRKMDLSKMASIGIFTSSAENINELHLYDIELLD